MKIKNTVETVAKTSNTTIKLLEDGQVRVGRDKVLSLAEARAVFEYIQKNPEIMRAKESSAFETPGGPIPIELKKEKFLGKLADKMLKIAGDISDAPLDISGETDNSGELYVVISYKNQTITRDNVTAYYEAYKGSDLSVKEAAKVYLSNFRINEMPGIDARAEEIAKNDPTPAAEPTAVQEELDLEM